MKVHDSVFRLTRIGHELRSVYAIFIPTPNDHDAFTPQTFSALRLVTLVDDGLVGRVPAALGEGRFGCHNQIRRRTASLRGYPERGDSYFLAIGQAWRRASRLGIQRPDHI